MKRPHASLLLRSVLVGTLAIGVTIGGVLAGALVVAPIVSRSTFPVISLPAPVTRIALPGLAVVAIVGALSTLFLRRRTAVRSLVSAEAETIASARGLTRLTARSTPRGGTKRHQTPRAVESLAARGATASDIARTTRLPIDAVQMLLTLSTGTRQLHPPAA